MPAMTVPLEGLSSKHLVVLVTAYVHLGDTGSIVFAAVNRTANSRGDSSGLSDYLSLPNIGFG